VLLPLFIYALTVAAVLGAGVVASRSRRGAAITLLVSLCLALLAQLFWTRPEYLVRVLPFADALFFGNWYPYAAALAAPALVRIARSRGQQIRIGILSVLLFAASLTGTARLFGKPAEVGATGYFADGTCRQSSTDTCSAAAAVTVLRKNGVEAEEKDIARIAFTKEGRGTHPLGLYRALKLAVRESTSTRRVIYQPLPVQQLLSRNSPAIVNVGLAHAARSPAEADLVAHYQWEPGAMHSVVFLRREGEKIWISDPDLGTEDWPITQFELLYRGIALYLE